MQCHRHLYQPGTSCTYIPACHTEVRHHFEEASQCLSQIPNSLADLQHRLLSIRHVTAPQLLTVAAIVASVLLIACLMQRAFQQQVCPILCILSSASFLCTQTHAILAYGISVAMCWCATMPALDATFAYDHDSPRIMVSIMRSN